MQIRLSDSEVAETPKVDAARNDHTHEITTDVAYRRLMLVNAIFYGKSGDAKWVLIDAGIPGMADTILSAASARFQKDVPPAAIILTHGHFDHVGSLERLAENGTCRSTLIRLNCRISMARRPIRRRIRLSAAA